MLRPNISVKDASRAIGVSATTVQKMLDRMLKSGAINCTAEKHIFLPDGSITSTSRGYTVPHPAGAKDELRMEVTMRELIFDFQNCYCRALHTLIPEYELRKQ